MYGALDFKKMKRVLAYHMRIWSREIFRSFLDVPYTYVYAYPHYARATILAIYGGPRTKNSARWFNSTPRVNSFDLINFTLIMPGNEITIIC